MHSLFAAALAIQLAAAPADSADSSATRALSRPRPRIAAPT